MKKIFPLCVICLFAASICQAAGERFNPIPNDEEAPIPPGRACACSKVNVLQIPEEIQFQSDMAQLSRIDFSKLSDEDRKVIDEAKNIKKQLSKFKVSSTVTVEEKRRIEVDGTIVTKYAVYQEPCAPYYYSKNKGTIPIHCEAYWDGVKDTTDKLHEIVLKNSQK